MTQSIGPGLMTTTGALTPEQIKAQQAALTPTTALPAGGLMTTGAASTSPYTSAGSLSGVPTTGTSVAAPTMSIRSGDEPDWWNPLDDKDGPLQGSGDSAENAQRWGTVYDLADANLGPRYMEQYGWGADQRLAGIGANAQAAGAQLGGQAAAVGMQQGSLASNYGIGAGEALTAEGATAQQAGIQGWSNAAADQQALAAAGRYASGLGTNALTSSNTYAGQIAGAGQAQLGQTDMMGYELADAARVARTTGADAQQIGLQGQQAIQQAAGGIGAAGQAGAAAGQAGMQMGVQGGQQVQQAGTTGQQALSSLGTGQGQFGTGVAQQGQQFLGQQGYQQQTADANQARQAAQGAAGQLTGIEAQEGPSAAQAQLRQGLNQAQSSNLAMARSARGAGGSASALRQASVQNAQAGQQAANQAAMLRAQENAAFRQRQAANLGAAGGLQLQAGAQALTREQQLQQAALGQQQANQSAFLAAQGIGQQGLAQQAATEAQARQMALAGQTQAAQLGMQGAQMGMQGANMQLTAEQARVAAAQAAAQTGLAGISQDVAAQQLAMQGYGQAGQQWLATAEQQRLAQQAAAQTSLAGQQTALQGAGMNLDALQAGGQLGLAGAGLAQQGIQNNIGATTAAAQQGLAGILGGGQLGIAGTQAGADIYQQGQMMGLTAEQQRAANTQYSYGLTQQQIQNMINIAQGQAGLNVQNANMMQQGIGSGVGAAAAMLPLLAMSDVNAKTDIVPLTGQPEDSDESWIAGQIGSDYASQARAANMRDTPAPRRDFAAGADPYGINFGADLMAKNEAAGREAQEKMSGRLGSVGANVMSAMPQGGMNPALNPITGQPWAMSDKRSKYYATSDERAKDGASEMVGGLDPYAFRYKDPERHGEGVHYGIMAQDLERSPAGRSVVEEGPDGLKRVNTPKLTMLNSAGLAAFDDRLKELEARVANGNGKKRVA